MASELQQTRDDREVVGELLTKGSLAKVSGAQKADGNCTECPLYGKQKVYGEGPSHAEVMFVGQCPGYYEVFLKRPFVGASGRRLDKAFTRVGLHRQDFYITNVCLCRATAPKTTDSLTSDETPSTQAIECCKKRLFREIKKVKPKVIVCLGAVAAKALLDARSLTQVRGRVFNLNGAKVMATFHPAKILRNWGVGPAFEADLKKIPRLLKNKTHKPMAYRTLNTVQEVGQMCKYLTSKPYFSVDTETTGYNFLSDRILCCQFASTETEGFCVPILGYKATEVWSEHDKYKVIALLKILLQSEAEKVCVNARFDLLFLRKLGIIEGSAMIWDVMLMHHLLNENLPHSLNEMLIENCNPLYVSDHLGISEDVISFAPKQTDSFEEVPPDLLHYYGSGDANGTIRVFHKLRPLLKKEKLEELYTNLTYPLMLATISMEERGIVLDTEELKRASAALHKEMRKKDQRIRAIVGDENFNPRSSVQLRKVFSKLGLQSNKVTAKGNVSFDKTVLKSLKTQHELPRVLLDLRADQKTLSTYLDGRDGNGGLLKAVLSDNRIHPRFFVHGTLYGRLSSSGPNFQSTPGDPSKIRRMFTVKEGWKFLGADYSKADLMVAASLSDDKVLMARLDGPDFHTYTARESGLCRKNAKPTGRQRFNAKMLIFALIYGSSPESIAARLELPLGLVKRYYQKFSKEYFMLARFIEKEKTLAKKSSFTLVNAFGRKRRFYDLDTAGKDIRAKAERQAVNFFIASATSEITSLATGRIYYRLLEMQAGLIGSLHDAVFLECPDEELDEVVEILAEELPRFVPELGYAPKVEIKVSTRWGGEVSLERAV